MKEESGGEGGETGKAGGDESGEKKAAVRKEAAEGGAEDKAEAEGGTDETHAFSPVFRGGDVGNVGLGNTNVAAGNAVNDAGEEEKGEGAGKAKKEKTKSRAKLGEDEDFFAAEFVGEMAKVGSGKKLKKGIGGRKKADLEGVGRELFGNVGQKGKDDAKAKKVHKDDKKDGGESFGRRRLGFGHRGYCKQLVERLPVFG